MKEFKIVTVEGMVITVEAEDAREACKDAIERGYRVEKVEMI